MSASTMYPSVNSPIDSAVNLHAFFHRIFSSIGQRPMSVWQFLHYIILYSFTCIMTSPPALYLDSRLWARESRGISIKSVQIIDFERKVGALSVLDNCPLLRCGNRWANELQELIFSHIRNFQLQAERELSH